MKNYRLHRYHLSNTHRSRLIVFLLVVASGPLPGLVNPHLQPSHLVQRHRAVACGSVTEVNDDEGIVRIRVTEVPFGKYAPRLVTISVEPEDEFTASLLEEVEKGSTLVAYVGKKRRRHEKEILLYAGRRWHLAELIDLQKPSEWRWTRTYEPSDEGSLVGTFNGAAEQLRQLMLDAAEGRDFFPAVPTVLFHPSVVLDTLPGPIQGVGLRDLDGDKKIDAYACRDDGNRAYLQQADGRFVERTSRIGLAGVCSRSCSFADVNGDGLADLLAGAKVYVGSVEGFQLAKELFVREGSEILCSAFVEINGDGHPDVILSRIGGGLSLFLHAGPGKTEFFDAGARSGLQQLTSGVTGFFAPGDWNGDGRIDLYYGADEGKILVQTEDGTWIPAAPSLRISYRAAEGPGHTGGGCFAPLWKPDRTDLVVASDVYLQLFTRDGDQLRNVTGVGNEIRLAGNRHIATLAEDLNVDGHVDLLTLTRKKDASNIFHANRGYGSYMLSELYLDYDAFPGSTLSRGACSAAAADVDGDGTTDLLLGGADGQLRLALNDALRHPRRQPKEHPTPFENTLAQTRILTVRPRGSVGVTGALVRVKTEDGRTVTWKRIGAHVLTGCGTPDEANFAMRDGGPHTVVVAFSDGKTRRVQVEKSAKRHVHVLVDHDAPR